MKNSNILLFIDWYIENRESKGSNYLAKSYGNDKELFTRKITEYSEEFAKEFGFNPFDKSYQETTEVFIENIQNCLKNKDSNFSVFNKKNGNGIPNAILGSKNYLRFLKELLLDTDCEVLDAILIMPHRKDFILWLNEEEGYSIGSSRDYASYVSSANKKILKDHLKGQDLFARIVICLETNNRNSLEDLLDLASSLVLKHSDDKSKSKFKNGLIQYKNFLLESMDSKDGDDVVNESFEEESVISTSNNSDLSNDILEELIFDKETLIQNFKFRMLTQDRIYGNVYFPVSFLKKLFYQEKESKAYFDSWILNQIEGIKLHVSENESVFFRDIESIKINSEAKVFVKFSSKEVRLYTEDGYGEKMKPIISKTLRNIAIDHIIPMKIILSSNIGNLKALKNITDCFVATKILKGSGKELLKSAKTAGNFILEEGIISKSDIENIKVDLEFVDKQIDLQLMDSRENLKKNKKR
jgi:hypothetical protein